MRFLPTRIHGMMDYPGGLFLIACPWVFGFQDDTAATWVLVALGIGMLVMSACTDYEMGVIQAIPMPAHLTADAVLGVLLAASPWLFGFAERVWIPHFVLGILELGAALTTELRPSRSRIGGKSGFGV